MTSLLLLAYSNICDDDVTQCILRKFGRENITSAAAVGTCTSTYCAPPPPPLPPTPSFPETNFCAPQDFTCLNQNFTVGGGTTLNAISSGNPDGLLCGFYRTASQTNVTIDGKLPGILNRNGTGAQMNVPGLVRFNHVAAGLGLSAYQFGND